MDNSNEVTISGSITLENSLEGALSAAKSSGNVEPLFTLSGISVIPKVLDKSAIHYDTTVAWTMQRALISEKGHIYIYSDYYVRKNQSTGRTTRFPAIKIGDGTSYLVDLPFATTGRDGDFIDHINDTSIHVTAEDRRKMDNKVSATVNEGTGRLVFTT